MRELPADPIVSIVVPMLDELDFIDDCLDGFAEQLWPDQLLEVLVVDGGSTDGSRETVMARAETTPWIRLIENPDRRASAAFNRGIEAATGDVVCLFSSHGVADPSFVERSVAALRRTGAVGVGGQLLHAGQDRASTAVGLAMVSPVGMASPFRYGASARDVDTIGHPAYRRDDILEIGPFDEDLERNSDYEFNWRLRDAGHRLFFDPSIVTVYRPRGSLAALARQFWWYGRWKVRVIRRHPRSLRPRHLVAPIAVIAFASAGLLVPFRSARRLAVGLTAAYGLVVASAVVQSQPARHGASTVTFVACFPVMHASWGAGFLVSVAQDLFDVVAHESDRARR